MSPLNRLHTSVFHLNRRLADLTKLTERYSDASIVGFFILLLSAAPLLNHGMHAMFSHSVFEKGEGGNYIGKEVLLGVANVVIVTASICKHIVVP